MARDGLRARATATVIPCCRAPPARARVGPAWRARLGTGADDALVCCMLAHLHAGKDHATLLHALAPRRRRARPDARPTLLLAGRDAGTASTRQGARLRPRPRRSRSLSRRGGRRRAGSWTPATSPSSRSHRELLPRGVTEPMAVGLPVVATDLPGTREALGSRDPASSSRRTIVTRSPPRSCGSRARPGRSGGASGAANAVTIASANGEVADRKAWTKLLARALAGAAT